MSSIHADFNGGALLTKPFVFKGDELEMNFSTSAAGGIKTAILNNDNKAYDGFEMSESIEAIGNYINGKARWKNKENLSSLEGKVVKLKILSQGCKFIFSESFIELNHFLLSLTNKTIPTMVIINVGNHIKY